MKAVKRKSNHEGSYILIVVECIRVTVDYLLFRRFRLDGNGRVANGRHAAYLVLLMLYPISTIYFIAIAFTFVISNVNCEKRGKLRSPSIQCQLIIHVFFLENLKR